MAVDVILLSLFQHLLGRKQLFHFLLMILLLLVQPYNQGFLLLFGLNTAISFLVSICRDALNVFLLRFYKGSLFGNLPILRCQQFGRLSLIRSILLITQTEFLLKLPGIVLKPDVLHCKMGELDVPIISFYHTAKLLKINDLCKYFKLININITN